MSANPTVNRRETRAKNATAHPGAILKRTLRRGKEEMEQARKEEDDAAKAAAVKKKKGLTRIAQLEQDIASKDSETDRTPIRRQKPPVLKRPMPFHDNAGGNGNKESTTTHRSQPRSNEESQDSDSSSGERAPVKKKKKVERVRETIKNLSLADKRAEGSDREEGEQLEVRIDKTVTCTSVNQKKIQIRFCTHMFLRLHEGTLFYFNLRTSNAQTNERALHVKNWADRVSHVAASSAASDRSRSTTEVSKLKSKNSSTAATMSTKSKSMTADKTADSDEELDSHQLSTLDLMEDENDDEERDAAVSSPIKGHQRLTNAVSISLLSIYMQIITFP